MENQSLPIQQEILSILKRPPRTIPKPFKLSQSNRQNRNFERTVPQMQRVIYSYFQIKKSDKPLTTFIQQNITNDKKNQVKMHCCSRENSQSPSRRHAYSKRTSSCYFSQQNNQRNQSPSQQCYTTRQNSNNETCDTSSQRPFTPLTVRLNRSKISSSSKDLSQSIVKTQAKFDTFLTYDEHDISSLEKSQTYNKEKPVIKTKINQIPKTFLRPPNLAEKNKRLHTTEGQEEKLNLSQEVAVQNKIKTLFFKNRELSPFRRKLV